MKQIVYGNHRKLEVVEEGEYKGVKYAILNLGTHPTAYVENIVYANDWNDYKLLDDVIVHGGFTYCDLPHWKDEKDAVYLGWDYAHLGDYMGYDGEFGDGMKWTYEEILDDVHSVIDQLLEIKRR